MSQLVTEKRQPERVPLAAFIDQSQRQALAELARREDRSTSSVVRQALAGYLAGGTGPMSQFTNPFPRRPPESGFPVGYELDNQGRRIDRAAEEAAERRRLQAAVLPAVGIETKEQHGNL
jgi:hypothetical protein